MQKIYKKIFPALLCAIPSMMMAQAATDVFKMSQEDLRGTARFLSMGGAFGALGGDLTVLDQNPGGIGVYRSSDVGVTVDFDAQSVKDGSGITTNQFKVACNNFGYIGAFKLDSEIVPNLNIGLTYTRPVSFNRHFNGRIGRQSSSLTDNIASYTNAENWRADDLDNSSPSSWDPYYDSNAPWMSILAYNSCLINPNAAGRFQGLSGQNSAISSEFEAHETGGVDQFNINFGGNIANVVYWGMGFGITDLDYKSTTYYGETVTNGIIEEFEPDGDGIKDTGRQTTGEANYGIVNSLHTFGTGYNFKLGVIIKPINEVRLGVAFHTPTYYSLKDESITYASADYTPNDPNAIAYGYDDQTNQGYLDEWWYKIRTPWKYMASAAFVIGRKGIVSFDYERRDYSGLYYSGDDRMYDNQLKQDFKDYYKNVNIFRVGGEYRLTPQFSVRAGYCYEQSPVNENAYNDRIEVFTVSTTPAYVFDKSTQYITCGLGYRYKNFYADMAYVHKKKEGEYHAFSSYVDSMTQSVVDSPKSKLASHSNRVVVSLGVRF